MILISAHSSFGQVACGNVSVSVSSIPPIRLFNYNGSYTVAISGGPGTYVVATNDGSTEDQDDMGNYIVSVFSNAGVFPTKILSVMHGCK